MLSERQMRTNSSSFSLGTKESMIVRVSSSELYTEGVNSKGSFMMGRDMYTYMRSLCLCIASVER